MNARSSLRGRLVLSFVAGILASAALAARADATTFDVNTTADVPASAAAVAQGVCDDGQGACSLRAAIQVADAASTPSTIVLPAGTYTLTVPGVDESAVFANGAYTVEHVPDPSKGDLNITQSMTLVGAGSQKTLIGWAAGSTEDRVFHIEIPPSAAQNLTVTIQGVTVENGYVPAPVNLDASVPTAVVRIARMGGGIAIGAGAEIQTVDSTFTEGEEDEGECGGGGKMGGGACAGPEGHGGPGESESGATIQMVTLSDVRVTGNHAGGEGGGIYNTGPITLDHVLITGNSSDANGGGLYNDAVMLMQDSEVGSIDQPNSGGNGGGLFETGFHTSVIERSAFIGNSASSGAGIAGRRMVLEVISRSTIAMNAARDGGGGIQTNGRVELINDTVSGNTVSGKLGKSGAGLNGFGPASQMPAGGMANAANFTLVNTIVSNNAYVGATPGVRNCGGKGESDPATRFYSMGHNIEDVDTCGLRAAGDRIDTDPMLGPLADNQGPTPTMALMAGSPAIDSGDSAQCPNEDQRGQMGRADGNIDGNFACDVGAYELFVPAADLIMSAVNAPDQVYVGDAFEVSATASVDPAATGPSTGVKLMTSALPSAMTLDSASITTAAGTQACSMASGVVSCDAGTLAPGALARMTLKLSAAAVAAGSDVVFSATQASPVDPNLANNAAMMRVGFVGNSSLKMTAAGPRSAMMRGNQYYTSFSIVNSGPDAASGVRVGVFLPPNVTYDSIDLPGGNCSYDGIDIPASVTCTVDSLPAGSTLSGVLAVTAADSGSGTATFAVDSPERDVNLNDNTQTEVLSVASEVPVASTPSGGGGGGCTSRPGGSLDPALILLAIAAALGVLRSRRRDAHRRG